MTLVLIEVPDEAAVERLRQQPGVRVVGVVVPFTAAPESSDADPAGPFFSEVAKQLRVENEQPRTE